MNPSPILLLSMFLQCVGPALFAGFLMVTSKCSSEEILSTKHVCTSIALLAANVVVFIPRLFEAEDVSYQYLKSSCLAYVLGVIIGLFLIILRKKIWKTFLK